MVMKKLLLALTLALAPAVASAQYVASYSYAYDLDSAAYVYPKLVGVNGDPFAGAMPGPCNIKTTGSSTSITEVTVGCNPFTNLAVGDVITITRAAGATPDVRTIITRTDAANIVVDTAINLPSNAFRWWKASFGTTDADGWIDLTGAFKNGGRIAIQYEQGDFATGFIWIVECRTQGLDPKPNQVYPGESSDCGKDGTLVSNTCQFATAPARFEVVFLPEQAATCRVGIKRSGADTSDAGAAIERISISAVGVTVR